MQINMAPDAPEAKEKIVMHNVMEDSGFVQGEIVQAAAPLAQRERASVLLAPVMNLETAKKRLAEFQEFVAFYLNEDEDFGTIPGTAKPTLYKPGADKLCELYGLSDDYVILTQTEDFQAEPPLFYYKFKCILKSRRDDSLVSTGFGSCSSYEGKYKYREMRRKCPTCQKETIIKGKAEYGGGWLCWNKPGKSDGCGAKFSDGDASIERQEVGKAFNDDIPTIANTILKMAKKRAKIDATLSATRSSGIFTQDMEDITEGASETGSKAAAKAVADAKLEPYKQKEASQVKGQTVEYFRKNVEGVHVLVFVPSPALAVLLENGLSAITLYSDHLKARFMTEDEKGCAELKALADKFGIAVKEQKAATPAPAAINGNGKPKIRSAQVKQGKKGEYLTVMYGTDTMTGQYSCFERSLWPAIASGVGKVADLITKEEGKFKNITGIRSIDGKPYSKEEDVPLPDFEEAEVLPF